MIMTGIVRIGRDAEIRTLANGTSVANLSIVFNYGQKQSDGNRASQWVDAAFFGVRAEKLAQYLLKGKQVSVVLDQPHIQTFTKNDGTESSKLAATILDIELISSPASEQPVYKAKSGVPAKQAPKSEYPDFNDEINF